MTAPVTVAFVCVQNAGRSQMAAALADCERRRRSMADTVEIHHGGTDPADNVHEVVVEAMAELGVDLSDEQPRSIPPDELLKMDIVVTMGCSAEDVCPATWRGDSRDWGLDDPHGRPLQEVRTIRGEIADRVDELFDELQADADGATLSREQSG